MPDLNTSLSFHIYVGKGTLSGEAPYPYSAVVHALLKFVVASNFK